MNKHPEKLIEQYLRKKVHEAGGWCPKLIVAMEKGFPDRTVILNGNIVFVELKAEGKKPTELQKATMRKIDNAYGKPTCLVIDSKEKVDLLVERLLAGPVNGSEPTKDALATAQSVNDVC